MLKELWADCPFDFFPWPRYG